MLYIVGGLSYYLVIYYIDNVIKDHTNLVFDYEDIELGHYESSISTII
jgi:hypothetical protein